MRLIGFSLLLAMAITASAYAAKPAVGEDAPALTGTDFITGEEVALTEYADGWIFIDFWATWCGPCMSELPNFLEQTQPLVDEGRLSLFSVSLDMDGQTSEQLPAVIEEYGIDYPVVYDGLGWQTAAAQQWDIHSIPATFLVDPQGRIAATDLRGESLGPSLEYYLQLPADHEYISVDTELESADDGNIIFRAYFSNPAMQDLELAVDYLFVKHIYAEDDTEEAGRPVDFELFETNPDAPEHTETLSFAAADEVFEYSIEKMADVDELYLQLTYELPGSAEAIGEPLEVSLHEQLSFDE